MWSEDVNFPTPSHMVDVLRNGLTRNDENATLALIAKLVCLVAYKNTLYEAA